MLALGRLKLEGHKLEASLSLKWRSVWTIQRDPVSKRGAREGLKIPTRGGVGVLI